MKQNEITRARAAELTAQLTEEEKLGLLTTHQQAVERLGLPEFYIGTEVARGFVGRDEEHYSTVFPQPVGMAASFDRSLMQQLGEIAGNECRAYYNSGDKSHLCVWGPTVDMERDPRWGRTEEAYGEDVFLAGEMTAALTKGMAGDDPVYLKVLPTLKHFCANNCEEERMTGNSCMPLRLKYEYYYAAFMPAIRYGGARSIMTAYNEINGVPALCNPEQRTILKGQWGLWFTVTDGADFGQTVTAHRYCDSHAEAYAEAVKAGCNIMTDEPTLTRNAAKKALETGLLTWAELDRALTEVLYARMRLGQFSEDCPYDSITTECVDDAAARAVNLRAAEEQLVLLKNDGILPLAPQKKLAVCGPLADENLMDWYTGIFRDAVPVVEGMRAAYPESEIVYDSLWDIVTVQASNGKYLCAHEDGVCAFDADEPTADAQFELQDWGENWQNLYSVKYGKYVRAHEDSSLRLHRRRVYDWFTRETFCLHETPDGTVIDAFQHYGRLHADAHFSHDRTLAPETLFRIETVSRGRDRAAALAAACDAVIYCTGNHPVQVAKECHDRKTLALNIQPEMALHLHSVNPATVMVLISGYPYAICKEQEELPAILWSTHAGAPLGTAAARAIRGACAPAGRLPMTWYRSEQELPPIGEYDIEKAGTTYQYFRGTPLYPFGYGLTYAEFRYESLTVQRAADGYEALVTLQNMSGRAADEVVQVYFTVPASAVSRPIRKLCGFARVTLQAGECRTVHIAIPPYILQIYDPHSGSMMTEAGTYYFYAGRSSADLRLSAETEVTGTPIPLRCAAFDAQQYDRASGVEIGYCRKLRRHDLRVTGWGGSAEYDGVVFAGAEELCLRAAAIIKCSSIGVALGDTKTELMIDASDSRDDFTEYRMRLPENLPAQGTLKLHLGEGISLLEIALE